MSDDVGVPIDIPTLTETDVRHPEAPEYPVADPTMWLGIMYAIPNEKYSRKKWGSCGRCLDLVESMMR